MQQNTDYTPKQKMTWSDYDKSKRVKKYNKVDINYLNDLNDLNDHLPGFLSIDLRNFL